MEYVVAIYSHLTNCSSPKMTDSDDSRAYLLKRLKLVYSN